MKGFITAIILCFTLLSKAQDSVLAFHQLASLPGTPTNGPCCFVIDSDLYVVGGSDSDGYYSAEVWKYHAPTNNWTRLSDFPQGGTSYAGAFVLNNKGYICGGLRQNNTYYHSVWQYSSDSDAWIQKNNYPGLSLEPFAYFSYNQRGYLGLGYPGPCNDLWEYNDSLDQWTALDTMSAPGRSSVAFTVSDSFLYCLGGYYRYIYGHTCRETWRFNLNNHHWEQLQDMPGTNRGYGAAWAVGNYIICGLGTHADTNVTELEKDQYIYNTQTGNWKPIAFQGFHDSVSAGFSFMIGQTGYYFGGVKRIIPSFQYTNELYSFDATPLLTTGISETRANINLDIYPNPLSANDFLSISAPEDGKITFTNGLGQMVYTTTIYTGDNQIPTEKLHTSTGILFYSAQLQHGTANGKVVIMK